MGANAGVLPSTRLQVRSRDTDAQHGINQHRPGRREGGRMSDIFDHALDAEESMETDTDSRMFKREEQQSQRFHLIKNGVLTEVSEMEAWNYEHGIR